MTSQGKSDEKQTPSNPQDLATAYREITKGEQTAAQLEANLTNLESKLDAMLAAFEQQDSAQGSEGGRAASADSTGGRKEAQS